MTPRALLAAISFPALAVSACAPEGGGQGGSSDRLPGYELAAAAELEVRDTLGQTGNGLNGNLIEISVEDLAAKLEQGNIRLIDVRRDDEVAQGMIPGAEHIAMDEFDPATLDMSDGREIVLHCRSGHRSGLVAEKLAAFTGEPVVHVAGGILAWQAAGKPVE